MDKRSDVANVLPKTANLLIELIGFTATMAIVQRWPGLRIAIPKGAMRRPGSLMQELEDMIGIEATRRLIGHFSGDEIYVPTCAAAIRNARDLKIIEDLGTMTVPQVALKYKMTERNIQYIGKKCPVPMASYNSIGMVRDERQMDMFGYGDVTC